MDIRRLVRGSVGWDVLEAVSIELAERLGREAIHVTFLETNNWSSIPLIVDEDYFVKLVTPQNALVHALFTGARNLGAISSGAQGFFDRYENPIEMAEHEIMAIGEMRSIGLNAPEPVDAFGFDDLGVVVMEYLPDFSTLADVDFEARTDLQEALFTSLAVMHANDVVHGDLRAENVLVYEDELYFIDATYVTDEWREEAMGYDLASAIAIASPRIGAKRTVALAEQHFSAADLLNARRFLDFVKLRPDHDFDVVQVRGEIETRIA